MYRNRITTALVAMIALAGAACSDSMAGGSGKVSVLLTDAPGDLVRAVVTIDQVYLQPGAEEGAQRVILRDDDVTVDLLTLANETASLVSETVVPAGSYQQLRFVISGGYIEVENADGSTSIYATSPTYAGLPAGETVDGELRMPSFARSGLKVTMPNGGMMVGGGTKIMLVDFDVAQSFGHAAGNSGAWVMSPVLHATEVAQSASVTVTLTRPSTLTLPTGVAMTDFKAVLKNSAGSNEELAFTDANADGVFEATYAFVLPGTYTVDLAAPAGVTFTTTETRPATVNLTSGGTATTAFTLATVTR